MGIEIHMNVQDYARKAAQKREFEALLAYEENCILKYDAKEGEPQRPSYRPKEGERMLDYARKHNVSIYLMKRHWKQVDQELLKKGYTRFQVMGPERTK